MDYLCNIKEQQDSRLNGYYVKLAGENQRCVYHTFILDCSLGEFNKKMEKILLDDCRYKYTSQLDVVHYSIEKKRYKRIWNTISFMTKEDEKTWDKWLREDYEFEYDYDCNIGLMSYDEVRERHFND